MEYLDSKLTTMRNGKIYEFVPDVNITAYELARIMLYLYACNSVGVQYVKLDSDDFIFPKYFKEV